VVNLDLEVFTVRRRTVWVESCLPAVCPYRVGSRHQLRGFPSSSYGIARRESVSAILPHRSVPLQSITAAASRLTCIDIGAHLLPECGTKARGSDACCPKPSGLPSKLDPWSVPRLRLGWEPDDRSVRSGSGCSKSECEPKLLFTRRTLVTRQEHSRAWESFGRKRLSEFPKSDRVSVTATTIRRFGRSVSNCLRTFCTVAPFCTPGTNDTFHGVHGPFGGVHCWGRRGGLPHRHRVRSQGFSPSQRFNPPAGSRTYFIPHPPIGFHTVFRAFIQLPSRPASSAR